MRTNPRQRAPLTRCDAIERPTAIRAPAKRLPPPGSRAWCKRSCGRCGSFQNLALVDPAMPIARGLLRAPEIWIDDALCRAA